VVDVVVCSDEWSGISNTALQAGYIVGAYLIQYLLAYPGSAEQLPVFNEP
jgi:hypothetical protein